MQFYFAEDFALIFMNLVFMAICAFGLLDIARNGVSQWYQLPLFGLFFVGLCGMGLWALWQQSRLRACPKCKTRMTRMESKGDGARRQRCPACGAVLITGRKGIGRKDMLEESP
jgi:hypothetical protein